MPNEEHTAVAVARLTEQMRHFEQRANEHAEIVKAGMDAFRAEVKDDIGQLGAVITRESETNSKIFERIAGRLDQMHDKMADPVSGIFRVQQDHAERILRLETFIQSVKDGVKKSALWVLAGVLGLAGIILVKFAPEIGKWLAEAGHRVAK